MSASWWINVGLGTVQALATLGALYFAWRTVDEARTTSRDLAQERVTRRLGEVIDAASQLQLAVMNANVVLGNPYRARFAALLGGLELDLPDSRAFADAPIDTGDQRIEAQRLGAAALHELGWAAGGFDPQ
jgi:hypothetical protein